MSKCRVAEYHCSSCGSADYEDVNLGDQGYSACCNKRCTDKFGCDGQHHVEQDAQAEIDATMEKMGYSGWDGRGKFIEAKGQAAFDKLVGDIFAKHYGFRPYGC